MSRQQYNTHTVLLIPKNTQTYVHLTENMDTCREWNDADLYLSYRKYRLFLHAL